MSKVKKLMRNQKIMIAILCLLVIVAIVIACLLIPKESQKQELKMKMDEMGRAFYENFYYQQVGSTDEDRAKFLKKFEEIGIKVNLDNLSRYNSQDSEQILNQFINKKTNTECDKVNTQVIIYPISPYNKTSYTLEVNLECGFNEE